MTSAGPRFLYLHGFASGPGSTKARVVAAHFEQRGVEVARLDLRQPSMTHLRLSKMVEHVRGCIGGPRDRAVIFGSSLGGLTACRAAEEDARISALVLLAPAFRMIERWRVRIGEEAWAEWQRSGYLETRDYAKNAMTKIDFGFAEDAGVVDAPGDGWPDVRVPTLILHGQNDEVVNVGLSRDWARGKRHVHLVELDDGHELTASLPRIVSESERFLAPFLGPQPTG